jgi:hypothetical protein
MKNVKEEKSLSEIKREKDQKDNSEKHFAIARDAFLNLCNPARYRVSKKGGFFNVEFTPNEIEALKQAGPGNKELVNALLRFYYFADSPEEAEKHLGQVKKELTGKARFV